MNRVLIKILHNQNLKRTKLLAFLTIFVLLVNIPASSDYSDIGTFRGRTTTSQIGTHSFLRYQGQYTFIWATNLETFPTGSIVNDTYKLNLEHGFETLILFSNSITEDELDYIVELAYEISLESNITIPNDMVWGIDANNNFAESFSESFQQEITYLLFDRTGNLLEIWRGIFEISSVLEVKNNDQNKTEDQETDGKQDEGIFDPGGNQNNIWAIIFFSVVGIGFIRLAIKGVSDPNSKGAKKREIAKETVRKKMKPRDYD